MNKLKEKYQNKIIKELKSELNLKNDLSVPTLEKLVVNIGLGEAVTNQKVIETVSEDLSLITGQKPVITKARKAISNFDIREGLPIGLKVTLRRDRMWDFYEKLVGIVLPRLKDFRGVSRKAFDGFGNYSLGIVDHTVFPEIDTNKIDRIRSFQVIIVTTAEKDEEGFLLLEKLGMPFAKVEDIQMMDRMKESSKKEKKELSKLKQQRL